MGNNIVGQNPSLMMNLLSTKFPTFIYNILS